MGASQPLPLEVILESKGLAKKLASLDLLSGLGARLTRASDLAPLTAPRDPIATTVPGLDRLLCGGLPRGGLVELSGRRSSGRFSIGLAAIASATSSGEAAALVDLGGHLDPQSAEAAGADLTRLLWVRPASLKEAVASAEMLLATGFPLVVADLGLAPVRVGCRRPADGVSYCRGDTAGLRPGVAYCEGSSFGGRLAVGGRTVPDAAWVRLERAARSHGAALLLLAPYRISGVAAGTVLAADTARAIWRGSGRSPRLLAGITSRLTLQKDLRARSGLTESLSFSMTGAISPVILSSAKDPGLDRHCLNRARGPSSLRSSG